VKKRSHIAYKEGSALKYTYKDVNGWYSDTVDSYGIYISLALDALGRPHISYGGNSLNYTYKSILNQAPTANAGPDQTVTVNTKVTLDGTASSDPDNNLPLTYEWSITTAPTDSAAQLSSTTADKPTFTPDKTGDYEFALNVTDNLGLQSTTFDTVKITANPTPTPTPTPTATPTPTPTATPTVSPTVTPHPYPTPVPGFDVGVAICALAAGYLMFRRYQTQ